MHDHCTFYVTPILMLKVSLSNHKNNFETGN